MLLQNALGTCSNHHDSCRIRVGGNDGGIDVVGEEVPLSDEVLLETPGQPNERTMGGSGEEAYPCILQPIRRRKLSKIRLNKRLRTPAAPERHDLKLLTNRVGLESREGVGFSGHEEDSRFRRLSGFEVEERVEVGDGGEGLEGGFAVEGDVSAMREKGRQRCEKTAQERRNGAA